MIIGICGGSGSGKTTLLKQLSEKFVDLNPSIFSMDNYYNPIDEQSLDENGIVNFDLPSALNENKLTADLQRLKSGEAIVVEEYHFNSPPDLKTYITIQPSKLIIVEGLFLFHYKKVFEALDFSVFVSVDAPTQLNRRIIRDEISRGYKREEIIYQWEKHVLPCYENYLLPYESVADFRFRNDENAISDFRALTEEINRYLSMTNVREC
ncbi:MAG: uridine kinase [Bacteroidota bacterium]